MTGSNERPLFDIRPTAVDTLLGPERAIQARFLSAALGDSRATAYDPLLDALDPLVSGARKLAQRYWSYDYALPEHLEGAFELNRLSMRLVEEHAGATVAATDYDEDEGNLVDAIGTSRFQELFNAHPGTEILDTTVASEHKYLAPRKGVLTALALRGVIAWEDRFAAVAPTPDEFLDFPYFKGGGRYYKLTPEEITKHVTIALDELKDFNKDDSRRLFSGIFRKEPKITKAIIQKGIEVYEQRLESAK